jgi:ribosome biogenesis protein ERB1
LRNTIGNVPLKWYDDYEHIGYDLDGEKISKPVGANRNDELDKFLDKMENPDFWRTVVDRQTGANIVLTDEDIDIIKRLMSSRYARDDVEEFDTSTFFTQDEMKMPLSGRPEHKRSFIPSNWERLQVGRYVHAIKMGWIKPRLRRPKTVDEAPKFYDIWGAENENDKRKHMHHLPAPKCPLPDHYESYNPPPEYLFDQEEKKKWESQEPEDRRLNFVPNKYTSLRLVPGFENFIKERFDRCLDLYMCPRQRKMRVQIDPQDLLPELPKPRDLQPFPTTLSIVISRFKITFYDLFFKSQHLKYFWLLIRLIKVINPWSPPLAFMLRVSGCFRPVMTRPLNAGRCPQVVVCTRGSLSPNVCTQRGFLLQACSSFPWS